MFTETNVHKRQNFDKVDGKTVFFYVFYITFKFNFISCISIIFSKSSEETVQIYIYIRKNYNSD